MGFEKIDNHSVPIEDDMETAEYEKLNKKE